MWNAYRYTFIDEETFIGGLAWNAYTFIDEETFICGPGNEVGKNCEDPGLLILFRSYKIGLEHISSFLKNENRKHNIIYTTSLCLWEIGSNASLSPHSCYFYNQKRHRTTHFCWTPYLHRVLTPPPARIAPLRDLNMESHVNAAM